MPDIPCNPTRHTELVSELREDDARLAIAPWSLDEKGMYSHSDVTLVAKHGRFTNLSNDEQQSLVHVRNNLAELADQLETADSQIQTLHTAER